MDIFFSDRGGCARCHGGINFSGDWIDRDHPAARAVFADTGTGEPVRVPTLRNLPATAPYMHDGRFATLDAVLDHYEKLAADSAADARLRRPALTTGERADLREFLGSLADTR
jgi:cytochrome c peroxidase